MKEIGGYFGWSFKKKSTSFRNSALRFNTARNALAHFLLEEGISRIFLPAYTCPVVPISIEEAGIEIEYYHIDHNFEIIDKESFQGPVLYTNYFGLMSEYIDRLAGMFPSLIVDNAQALYHSNEKVLATIYSPRKFLGMPDGGLLSTKVQVSYSKLEIDESWERCSHLLKRVDISAEAGFSDFRKNDSTLNSAPIRRMSQISSSILDGADHQNLKVKRKENFSILSDSLSSMNDLRLSLKNQIPVCYPLLVSNGDQLKEKLIKAKVYTPTYWKGIADNVNLNSFEDSLVKNLIALPIDQRYGKQEMTRILDLIISNG